MRMTVEGMILNGYKMTLQSGKKELERVCPKCHESKPLCDFGFRCFEESKEIRLQSYCTKCRAS